MKNCSRCDFKGSLNYFPRYKYKGKYNYRTYCKMCEKKRKDVWRRDNLEHHNKKCKEWCYKNPVKRKKSVDKWKNNNKEYYKKYYRRYRQENKCKINAATSSRRKRVQQSTPKWLTKEQKKQIRLIYEQSSIDTHVDHIVPLKGENVCGLHVPWNLQLLSAEENIRKNNNYAL